MNSNMNTDSFICRMTKLSNTCLGCKFYDSDKNYCKERNIEVEDDTPKCDKWIYFA